MFEQGIAYFSLHTLPPGHLLAWQPAWSILIHLYADAGKPRIQGAQQFTDSEMCLLLPLLQAHPGHCSYASMLAHYHSPDGTSIEQLVAQIDAWLKEAQGTQAWEQQMQPVRDLFVQMHSKLQALGLDIGAVLGTGYVLLGREQEQGRGASQSL